MDFVFIIRLALHIHFFVRKEIFFSFIAFYSVMGTLSHSKIILELLLQNDNTDLLLVIK